MFVLIILCFDDFDSNNFPTFRYYFYSFRIYLINERRKINYFKEYQHLKFITILSILIFIILLFVKFFLFIFFYTNSRDIEKNYIIKKYGNKSEILEF